MYNVYPEKTKQFIEDHVQILSAYAWQASTEKLEKDFKEALKKKRKQKK